MLHLTLDAPKEIVSNMTLKMALKILTFECAVQIRFGLRFGFNIVILV